MPVYRERIVVDWADWSDVQIQASLAGIQQELANQSIDWGVMGSQMPPIRSPEERQQMPAYQSAINHVRVARELRSADPDRVRLAMADVMNAEYVYGSYKMTQIRNRWRSSAEYGTDRGDIPQAYYVWDQRRQSHDQVDRLSRMINRFGRTGHWSTCAWSGALYPVSQMREVDGHGWISREVYQRNSAECTECGGIHHRDNMNHRRDEILCSDCYEEARRAATPYTCDYSGNPLKYLPGFLRAEGESEVPTPLYLGVELEVELRDSDDFEGIGAELREELPHCIFKPDGSLSEQGIEIVSVPCTLDYHRTAWDQFFGSAAKKLKGWHTGSCGMHVHMSINAINDLTLGKMLVWVNDPQNEAFITRMAGRYMGHYCFYAKKFDKDYHGPDHFPRLGRESKRGTNHYDALSVSTHTECKTVEMRIFRSNVSRGGFLKNLEFCVALKKFCDYAPITELTSTDFIKWMRSHRKPYPELHGWLRKEKYIRVKELSRYEETIQAVFSEAA